MTACRSPEQPGTESSRPAPDEAPSLLPLMTVNGHLLHKLALAAQARNTPLADFYLYELEEALQETIDRVPEYEGMPIATLTRDLLMPFMDPVRESVEAEDWDQAGLRVEALVQACNQCHIRTDHGYIRVTSGTDKNPFNQVFEPQPGIEP